MARKLRLQYKGAIYHVSVRGNGRRRIFRDDRDRGRLLWRLNESKNLYEVRIYLYCLMDNHFHLLVETPRANISRFMQSALTGYSVYFNLKHHTSGHVLQGRFEAPLVEGDRYLLNLSRYVHLNPVCVRDIRTYSPKQKAKYLRAYRWSSYRGYIDPRSRNELVDYDPLLSLTYGAKKDRETRFQEFVEGGLAETEEEFADLIKSKPRSIGGNEFRAWVDEQYEALKQQAGSPEDVSFRQEAKSLDAEKILDVVLKEFQMKRSELTRRACNSLLRPVAAFLLCKYGGLTQRAAAKKLGYGTGAAVGAQVRKLGQLRTEKQSKANRQTRNLEKQLRRLQERS